MMVPNATTWAEVSEAHSLAQAPQGQCLRIRSILFDSVRSRCLELGVAEGDLIRVLESTPSQLTVETEAGRVLALPVELGRFVHAVPDLPSRRYAPARRRPGLSA